MRYRMGWVYPAVWISLELAAGFSGAIAVPQLLGQHLPLDHLGVASSGESRSWISLDNEAIAATLNPTDCLAQEIVTELNRLRSNPRAYADWLDAQRQYYTGTVLTLPGEMPIRTHEGVAALNNAIAVLRTLEPRESLTLSRGMTHATQDHASDLGETGRMDDVGSDGSFSRDRLNRYGTREGIGLELTSAGKTTASAIVMMWVLGDGDTTRSIRTEILDPIYSVMGTACHSHRTEEVICVTALAEGYVELESTTDLALQNTQPTSISDRTSSQTVDQSRAILSSIEMPVPSSPPSPQPTSPSPQSDAVSVPQESNLDPSPLSDVTTPYLTALEQGIVTEINRLHQNPRAYASELRAIRDHYDDNNILTFPGLVRLETAEGVEALDEAIAVLETTDSLPELQPNLGLSQAATDHASDLGHHNLVGHIGSDRSDPQDRAKRYGDIQSYVGETISYTPDVLNTAHWHVMQLLIDDNYPSRGHRDALLNPNYHVIGVACHSHPVYDNVCVITYADTFTENRP